MVVSYILCPFTKVSASLEQGVTVTRPSVWAITQCLGCMLGPNNCRFGPPILSDPTSVTLGWRTCRFGVPDIISLPSKIKKGPFIMHLLKLKDFRPNRFTHQDLIRGKMGDHRRNGSRCHPAAIFAEVSFFSSSDDNLQGVSSRET